MPTPERVRSGPDIDGAIQIGIARPGHEMLHADSIPLRFENAAVLTLTNIPCGREEKAGTRD